MNNTRFNKTQIMPVVNKIIALALLYGLYVLTSTYKEYANMYLPDNLLYMPLLINICFGLLLGWFLCDNLSLKGDKHLMITTFFLLLFLSLGTFFPYSEIAITLTKSFPTAHAYKFVSILYDLARYFQIAFGIFVFLLLHGKLQKAFSERKSSS